MKKKKNVNIFRLRQWWEKWLTVGMAVAIVATTAALAPAITPSTYSLEKKIGLESAYTMR